MSSRRIAAKASQKNAEKISHFIVEWIESDTGAISLVPREKIASDPPYSVGNTVIVKFADKKGVRVTEKAIIRSQGSKEAMKAAQDRLTCDRSMLCEEAKKSQPGKPKISKPTNSDSDDEGITDDDDYDAKLDERRAKADEADFIDRYKDWNVSGLENQPAISKRQQTSKGKPDPSSLVSDLTSQTFKEKPDLSTGVTSSASAFNVILNELAEIRATMERIEVKLDGSSHTSQAGCVKLLPKIEAGSPVVHNNTDLTAIAHSANSPQKYARKVLAHLFTEEEMAGHLFYKAPSGSSSKPMLSPGRSELVTKCLEKKYTPEFLGKKKIAIRESLNQKCRDARKKSKPVKKLVSGKGRSYCSSDEGD